MIIMDPTNFKKQLMNKNPISKSINFISLIPLFIILSVVPLMSLSFVGNTGYAIPLGSWSTYHNPSPFFSFETNFINKKFYDGGFILGISSFSGKFNRHYTLQAFSPGISVKFYPLFFINNRNLFLNNSLSFSYMIKNIHDVKETGGDFTVASNIGGKFIFSNNWSFSIFIGENHSMGGLDQISLGMGIEFIK